MTLKQAEETQKMDKPVYHISRSGEIKYKRIKQIIKNKPKEGGKIEWLLALEDYGERSITVAQIEKVILKE